MKIKEIIAREGLILIGVILLACFIAFISSVYPPYPKLKSHFDITTAKPVKDYKPLTEEQFNKEKEAGFSYDDIVKFEKIRKGDGKKPFTPEEAFGKKSINTDYEVIESNPIKASDMVAKINDYYKTDFYNRLSSETKVRLELFKQKLMKGYIPQKSLKSLNNFLNNKIAEDEGEWEDLPDEQLLKIVKEGVDQDRDKISSIGLSILFIAYALYLIPIKFILWAVRTLRGSK